MQAERSHARIFTYFGALIFLVALASPSGYLGDISTTYMLKNRLHASAAEVSNFRLVTAIPVYLAFAFGLIRDRWNPFGLRDRGYLLIFAPITALAYAWLAWQKLSFGGLVVGMLVVQLSFRLIVAAYQGLLSLIGKEQLMSGRLVTLWQIVAYVPAVVAAFASGYAARYLDPRHTFEMLAVLALLVGLVGLTKPRAVFEHAYDQPEAKTSTLRADLARLAKHKAIYPAILVNFLWSFAPGAATPLQYYLTNELHANDAVYANFNAIFVASFIPTLFLYGYLCKRVRLRTLLVWGTVAAIPQMIPLALVHSATSALWLAAPIGLMGGVATAAYFDLAVRSCPAGLQGTLMMAVEAVMIVSMRFGDRLGSAIYDANPSRGFVRCVVVTTIVYVLILPVIFTVPKKLIATRDGEALPD